MSMSRSNHPLTNLGAIRMSPLMYGSLRYIATRHNNGALTVNEVLELRQTQLRSFKHHEWILETADRNGIVITKAGKAALKSFEENDEFFRRSTIMSFSAILNLRLPDEDEPAGPKQPVSENKIRRIKAA